MAGQCGVNSQKRTDFRKIVLFQNPEQDTQQMMVDFRRDEKVWPTTVQLRLCTADQLPARPWGFLERSGDLNIIGIKDLTHEKRRTRFVAEPLEQNQVGHRHIIRTLTDILGRRGWVCLLRT